MTEQQLITKIPPITNPLGKHWDQPNTNEILLDENCAVMGKETFNKLHEYSLTNPTALYAGKMWKSFSSQSEHDWWLKFCFEKADDPGAVYIRSIPILILEV